MEEDSLDTEVGDFFQNYLQLRVEVNKYFKYVLMNIHVSWIRLMNY